MANKRLDKEIEDLDDMRLLLERIESTQESTQINDWETDFLESIHKAVLGGNELTGAQQDKLEQIEDTVANGRVYDEHYGY